MDFITLTVGQMQENCYLVFDNVSKDALIIDPGDDADYIERIISDHSLTPKLILATHGHFDHCMAVLELKLAYKIPFFINFKDKFLIKNMSSSARHFLGIDAGPPPEVDANLIEGKSFRIGKSSLKVMETPGHTPGSVCLYDQIAKRLYTGDTLFAEGGIGRTDFKYSSQENLVASLEKIFKLPNPTEIYPGHGRPSTLEEEKINHRF